MYVYMYIYWLVVWNILCLSIIYWESSFQLTFIFVRGVETTNQIFFIYNYVYVICMIISFHNTDMNYIYIYIFYISANHHDLTATSLE